MNQVGFIVFSCLFMLTRAQAESINCTQPINKEQRTVSCGTARVQADIPLDEKKSLAATYPDSTILSGDLDHDGINDFVVGIPTKTDYGMGEKVIVLKGKHGKGYENFAMSSDIEGFSDIEIKNQSFYILVDHNSLVNTHRVTYQFKYRSDGIYLIGEEEYSALPGNDAWELLFRISTNYLTGDIIKYERTDNQKIIKTKSRLEKDKLRLLRFEDFKEYSK